MVQPLDKGLAGVGRGPNGERWTAPRWRLTAAIFLALVVLAAAASWMVLEGVYDTYRVRTSNMAPTLQIGDHALARPAITARHGDVVIYLNPRTEEIAIARVVAVEGDRVGTHDGLLVINGVEVTESYLAAEVETPHIDEWTIPRQHFYLLGDNRSEAVDSRTLGAIRGDALIARVVARSWPYGRIGGI